MELTEIQTSKENKRSEDDNRKQRKKRQSPVYEMDKEKTKKSRRVCRFITCLSYKCS